MLDTCLDLEIKMLIPSDDLVFYPDDSKDEYITDPNFQKIADYLNIKMDIPELYNDLCKGLFGGKMNPSISVYYADNTYKDFILTDTYRDPTDQLDFILIGIRCTAEHSETIKQYTHEFYKNRCKYNVMYAEGNYEIRDHYNIDFSKYKAYYRLFKPRVKNNFKWENSIFYYSQPAFILFMRSIRSYFTHRKYRKKNKTIHFYKSGRLI